MSRPSSPDEVVRVPADAQDMEGYELQIALDQLAAGSTDALKTFLARRAGVDPNTVTLRSTPWKASEDAEYSYVGQLDDTRPPDEKDKLGLGHSHPAPRVALEDTEKPFDYKPLDPERRQFRLLKLGPPDENGIITHFRLETFCLDDAPPYFCLSYVWGDPKRFLGVNCNGEMISVTQNLFHALANCFNRHPDSWLWADGICINQDDIVERSQQVLLMGNIYQNATIVLAHPGHYMYGRVERRPKESKQKARLEDRMGGLGVQDMLSFGAEPSAEEEDSEDSDSDSEKPYGIASFHPEHANDAYSSQNAQGAMSIMTFLTRTWTDARREKILSDREWDKVGLPDPQTEEGKETWKNLLSFWNQDWYFRTWVLQEVILAKKVVVLYNQTAISLEAITDFWALAKQYFLPKTLRIGIYADIFNTVMHLSPVSSFKALRERRQGKTKKSDDDQEDDDAPSDAKPPMPSLLELLVLSRNNLATDARDKVYGLLGLTDDAVAQSVIPDYASSNTTASVFTEVATEIVNAGQATDLLHHAGVHQSITGLPSWVPDWTMQSRSTLPAHLYQSTGKMSPKVSILETGDKPKLVVRGAIISRVNHAGPAWKFYSHDRSQHPFGGFKHAPEVEIPPFNDEDARNFILTFATRSAEDVGERYSEEGVDDALVRTLVVDCSRKGQRIGRRETHANEEKALTTVSNTEEEPDISVSDEFFAGVEAFRKFYARGPTSEEDLSAPGIRVHQTMIFMWLLDFDEEVEADLQKRMVPYTVPFQEAQRGRRFATLGTRAHKTAEDVKAEEDKEGEKPKHKYATKSLEHHFMGTLPWNAEIEDYIVLLEGFRTPFVLRRCEEGPESEGKNDEFMIIGDCYVHGIMDGEMLCWADEVEEKLEPDYISQNDEGRAYGIRAPQGFVPFTDFTIV